MARMAEPETRSVDEYPPGGSVSDARLVEEEVRCVRESNPEKYRTVLVLRDLENFSTSEIAAILNRKEATIRWRLAEARMRFQELWKRRQGPDAAPLSLDHATDRKTVKPS